MASLKKLPANKTASLSLQLHAFLKDVFVRKNLVNPKLVLGLSGGLDSVVLLHLLVNCKQKFPFKLSAHHVHHGLSLNADHWADFCNNLCKKLDIPFTLTKVKVNINSGLGIESAARNARYQALLNGDADLICVAHHQDDQAETFLLQLARGAGVKGLASMGSVNQKIIRPLLNVSRSALEVYANQHHLTWVDDESNIDTTFDRNFIRHEVLPVFAKQYPAIYQTLARSASHLAEADMLLEELAAMDIAACQQELTNTEQIKLAPLAQLSAARIHNALRWWLSQHACNVPSAAHLRQIRQQLFDAKSDAMIIIKLSGSHILCRFQGSAFIVAAHKQLSKNNPLSDFSLVWKGEKHITLPDRSHLTFSEVMGAGIAMRHIADSTLLIRYRQGGETLKPDEHRPSRSLKSIFQTSSIPPWQRERLPLVFINHQLAAISNIVVAASFKAQKDELGLLPVWQDNFHHSH